MKTGRLVSALLGLGLLIPAVGAAQETPKKALLLARLRLLDRGALAVPSEREVTAAKKDQENLPVQVPVPGLWSLDKSAAQLAFPPQARKTGAAPGTHSTYFLRAEARSPSLVTPLPRNLPPTMLTHSRVRGPFEQVYPRRW